MLFAALAVAAPCFWFFKFTAASVYLCNGIFLSVLGAFCMKQI